MLLGTPVVSQTERQVRLIGYKIDNATYWVATGRFDLSAEGIATIYRLRWDIEKFFAWRKRHLKVCHIIARSINGLMIQILAGLITYLLLALYFQIRHNVKLTGAKGWRERSDRNPFASEFSGGLCLHVS